MCEARCFSHEKFEMSSQASPIERQTLRVRVNTVSLEADLSLPGAARGIVLFAHGSGSSRFSPRNREVAERLNDAKLATMLVDLLTSDEEAVDERTRELRFDIGLLADRLVGLYSAALGQASRNSPVSQPV